MPTVTTVVAVATAVTVAMCGKNDDVNILGAIKVDIAITGSKSVLASSDTCY